MCVVAVITAGCTADSGALRPAAPDGSWQQSVLDERARKDEEYRSSSDTPLRKEDVASFRGLEYWPVDPRWRFTGPVEVNARLERFNIITTTGKERPCERYGRVRIPHGGDEHVLHVYRLLDLEPTPGQEALFLPFLDGTTGQETYPAGRYVDLVGPKGGPYVLDFNRAYNPLCAYGDAARFRCPVTPAENRLPFRVEAGERGYRRDVEP
jgi:uncharacterized protein (DUF1684 family)